VTSILDGRRVLVTGGARGIGRAIVDAATAEGATCAVICRTAESAEALNSDYDRRGIPIAVAVADVTEDEGCAAAVPHLAALLGGLDVLVNSAARVAGDREDGFFTTAPELMRHDFDEKVVGALRCARAAFPFLRDSGSGRIINIGGEAARQASKNVSSGARNAAIVHLTHSMAMELGEFGITVNAIHPGVVLTDTVRHRLAAAAQAAGRDPADVRAAAGARSALGRLVEPGEVAAAAIFLASAAASGITSQVIAVSGGSSRAVYY
jgi:NAD(P)-dependent dehydrogenase (short-subunit alcohol dehydrogenase family)